MWFDLRKGFLGSYVTGHYSHNSWVSLIVDYNSVLFFPARKKQDLFYLRTKHCVVLNCGSSAADETHLLCNRDPSSPHSMMWCLAPPLRYFTGNMTCVLPPASQVLLSQRGLQPLHWWALLTLINGDIVLLVWMLPLTPLGRSDCLDGQLACHVGYITPEDADIFFLISTRRRKHLNNLNLGTLCL